MYVRPFRYDFHLIKSHIKSIRVGLDLCAESSSNLFKTLGHSLWRVPGSACERFWTDPSICFLNQVMTCGCRCGSSFSAGPGPPVMNGIFKICHWTWASFLTKSCRRPLHLLSVFCPRASGLESLKCFLFYGPSAAWGKSALRCQSVHDGTLLKSLLESGFAWSSYLLISGCFLSVTILYITLRNLSIRRPHKVIVQYLCIFRIDLHISKVV